MDTVIQINPFEVPINGSLIVKKLLVLNGEILKTSVWRCLIDPSFDFSLALPCQWIGDGGKITPVSFDDFPAEKAYIQAKWAELNS